MDRKALYRERMRKKQQQLRRRRLIKRATYIIGAVLLVVFVVRGVIMPISQRVGRGKTPTAEPTDVQADVNGSSDTNTAVRQPLKGQGDLAKVTRLTPGWHEDENGKWYQNADGTYYASGFQDIGGDTYYFGDNGYIATGWISVGAKDYYFSDNGVYDSAMRRKMLALTYDDGPGKYTSALLDCLEENNARATFFMLGENIEYYPEEVQRMVSLGCEIGNHSWDHPNLDNLTVEAAVDQYQRVDDALLRVCGQISTVARCPYGNGNSEKFQAIGKPFFMWSLDSMDWSYRDVEKDYNSVMNGDLTDGSIILMHDIHPESVEASLRIIPDLVARGYKLVTLSELAEAKGVELQYASYSDFWDSSLNAGIVPGYTGKGTTVYEESSDESSSSSETSSQSSDNSSDSDSYGNSYSDSYSDSYDSSYGNSYDSYN